MTCWERSMNLRQLAFKADPDSCVVMLTPIDVIREGDHIEWAPNDWTSIDKGSNFIGEIPADPPGMAVGYGFARIVPREERHPSLSKELLAVLTVAASVDKYGFEGPPGKRIALANELHEALATLVESRQWRPPRIIDLLKDRAK